MKRSGVVTVVKSLFLSGCCCLVLAALGTGCKKKATGVIIGTSDKTIEEMAPDDVIVAVNGVALTRRAYDDLLDRMVDTYGKARPGSTLIDLKSYRQARAHLLIDEFVTKEVLVQEARRRGLKPSEQALAVVEGMVAKRAKREGKTTEQYLESIDPASAKRIRQDMIDQALIQTLRQVEFGDRLHITDADLQEARDRVSRYNEMCEATNALVKARADAVCERLRKGEDFSVVAKEVSEEEETAEQGGFWGEFTREDIEDEAVRNAAFSLPVGAVSEPFDTDEGLVIIKVLEREGVDSIAATSPATVKVARIFFQLGEFREVLSDSKLRSVLERERLTEVQRDWLPTLIAKMRVEFPNGRTNLLAKARSKKPYEKK